MYINKTIKEDFMKRFWQAVKEEKQYLILSASIFFVSMIYSYFYADELYRSLTNTPVFEQLMEIVKDNQQNPTFLNVFTTIFLNNLRASFTLLISGVLFCIFPFIGMISNGLILGVVLGRASVEIDANPIMVFIKYVLPHGILELPALFLAAAMGIHLGVMAFRFIFSFWRKQGEQIRTEWKQLLKKLPIYSLGIVILLFFAAIIESLLILSSL
jgi:stage II sporulation protein M